MATLEPFDKSFSMHPGSPSLRARPSTSFRKAPSGGDHPEPSAVDQEGSKHETTGLPLVTAEQVDGTRVLVAPVNRSTRAAPPVAVAPLGQPCCNGAPGDRAPLVDSWDAGPDAGWGICPGLAPITPENSYYQAYLSYLTIGIVYGDVGTSPLYTFSSIFPNSAPSESDVMGALSLVLWTYILVVLVKYMFFILMADDNGEGGTFAIYALLSRGLRKHIKDDWTFNRVNDVFATLALIGVSMILSDGVLTPAISVLGAVAGLTIATPVITQGYAALITCLILLVFFLFQYKGTAKISFLFTPVIIVWFLALAMIGIYNIAQYPQVFAAFNPAYGFDYFITYGYNGWASLGAIILAVTGTEAEYADMGHFNKKAMRYSSLCLVAPSLILCYLGQAAALIKNNSIYTNVFYLGMPSSVFYPMLVLSTLAAIIASQAMVSATFSIIAQAMRLQLVPRMTVIHTSRYQIGQIYVPEVNYFYMLAGIAVVAGFQTTTALGYAYGITVSSLFVITTIFYSFVIVFNFERHWIFAVCFAMFYGLIDVSLWTANLLKFTTGGWFSIVLAFIFSFIMITWRWGRLRMIRAQKAMTVPYAKMFDVSRVGVKLAKSAVSDGVKGKFETGDVEAQLALAGEPLTTSPVVTIPSSLMLCYSSSSTAVPAAFEHFIRRVPVRPQYLVFVTIEPVNVPFVQNHIDVVAIPDQTDVYSVLIHHGYAEPPPPAPWLAAHVVRVIGCLDPSVNVEVVSDEQVVVMSDPTFIHGKDSVVPREGAGWLHQFGVFCFQILLSVSHPFITALKLPHDRTVELGLSVQV